MGALYGVIKRDARIFFDNCSDISEKTVHSI